jgi:Aromatic-ring-opening dioxygenase LigAB, LigA subunit
MSVNTLERVLWELSVNRDSKRRFQEDSRAFLSRYQLTDHEAQMIGDFDVRGLADAGVSTMLTMGFWTEVHTSRSVTEYLERMKASARSSDGSAKRNAAKRGPHG